LSAERLPIRNEGINPGGFVDAGPPVNVAIAVGFLPLGHGQLGLFLAT
jgi:hypothetical protein